MSARWSAADDPETPTGGEPRDRGRDSRGGRIRSGSAAGRTANPDRMSCCGGLCCGFCTCYYCAATTREQKESIGRRVCALGFVLLIVTVGLTVFFSDVTDPVATYSLRRAETLLLPCPSAALYESVEVSGGPEVGGVSGYAFVSRPPLSGRYLDVTFVDTPTIQAAGQQPAVDYPFVMTPGSTINVSATVSSQSLVTVTAIAGDGNFGLWAGTQSQYAIASSTAAAANLSYAVPSDAEANPPVTWAVPPDRMHWAVTLPAQSPGPAAGVVTVHASLQLIDVSAAVPLVSWTGPGTVNLDGAAPAQWMVVVGPAVELQPNTLTAIDVTLHLRSYASAGGRIALVWGCLVVAVVLWVTVELWWAKRMYAPVERDQQLIGETLNDAFD